MLKTAVIFFLFFQKLSSNHIVSDIVDKSQCVRKILKEVFDRKLIQYYDFEDFLLADNQVVIFDNFDHRFAYTDIAVVIEVHEIESIINKIGFDKNVLLIAFNESIINHTELLLKTWFKYRTKLAIASLSNQKDILVTNTYVKNYAICPNMNYKVIQNICSSSPKVTSKSISAKKFCILNISYIKVSPFVTQIAVNKKEGIMVSWMQTFGKVRGFDIHFLDNNKYQNEFVNNGSFHKLIADLVKRKLDVAIGHLFINSSEEYPVDFGPVIYMDKIGILHRKLNKISNFKKMIVVFDKGVWIYLITTYIIVIPIYYLLNYLLENHVLLPSVVMTDIFRLSVGSAIPFIPKSFPLRILFTCFCMFGITLNSVYMGKLTDVFTNPPTDFKEDIWDHGVRVHISYIIERLSCISYFSNKRDRKSVV